MDPKFVVPVWTMLAGVALWLAWVIARALSRTVKAWPAGTNLTAAIVTGGLIVVSGGT